MQGHRHAIRIGLILMLCGTALLLLFLRAAPGGREDQAPQPSARGSRPEPAAATSTAAPSPSAHDVSVPAAAAVHALLLPPPDAPLAQTFDELLARTRTGDKPAAERLYRDLMHCRNHATSQTNALYWSSAILAQKPENTSERELDAAQSQLQQSSEYAALCDGTDERMLGQLTPVMLDAARLGVADARECYVHRGPYIDLPSLLHHPGYLAIYSREAPALIDAAIEDGDWKMVDMLQYAYGSHDSRSLVSGLVDQDPLTHYRYLALYRLGADDQAAARIDARLSQAASSLDPAAMAQADAWARQAFDQYFRGSGNSTTEAPMYWDACAVPL